ncbi:MFS transporter [Marinilabilia rubra]|uniref:MFS transporter n=1 Tax=Marinilabilia rubra TaxID=2162893 RepID=A0A2U2BCA7_9BACT|nr:MFS transporter [Marinilabilia rubra]PWE00705.1 MFS transporter [Marinilabilia rubra]
MQNRTELSPKTSQRNFYAFLWHASLLAFAKNFMDVDTVLPAMLIESGGTSFHVGIMTAILLGGVRVAQLFFAPYISNKPYKKKFLLLGINSRILSILALGGIIFFMQASDAGIVLWMIFLFISIFALGGAFANVSYMDIIGKSVLEKKRKTFFSTRQILSGGIVLISAFMARKVLAFESYPVNYAYLFMAGGFFLLLASLGFWRLKEELASSLKIRNSGDFFRLMRKEIKENKSLPYFMGFVNSQGIAVAFLPFVILYGKDILGTEAADTGNFLVFKVIGIVLVSVLIAFGANRVKYNFLLYGNVLLSVFMAVFTLFSNNAFMLQYVFLIGGIVFALYNITMNGLLLEVSGRENRALYAGISGGGNVLPVIFPLVGGWIIDQFGFSLFVGLFIFFSLCSIYFIYKIDCRK